MPELPNKRYIRRGVICLVFGIEDDDFTKLVRSGVLKPYYLGGKGRAWFKRDEVVNAEAEGKIFKSEKA